MADVRSGSADPLSADPRPAEVRTETVSFGPSRLVADGELPPGHVVAGRYELRDLLGRGGYGLVYEAVDLRCGRVVALKVLRADRWSEVTVRRFRREAELVRHFHHPRLARVFETGSDGADLYLTMERVWGESLGCRLRRGPLPIEEAIDVAIQVAEALEVLHGAGLVHRDVKPPNVLLDARGRVKLADFGLTRCSGAGEMTGDGHAVGTAEYMAPEEALGEPLDARSDLYSLGVVLFEMLGGEPPDLGRTPLGTLLAHLQRAAPDVRRACPEAPAWLARVVAGLLARRPEDRYRSAAALLDDLRARRAATSRGSKVRRAAALGAALGLAACALAVQELRPGAELRELVSGPGGLSAVGPGGEVLWSLPGRTGELVRARLKPDEPERLVGIVTAPEERGPEAVRHLTTFDEATGEPIRSVELVSGAGAFDGFADRYGFRVAAVDLDGDGLDEVVVSYSHTPYWPSYVVLYEPLLERSRVAFLGSGHHRFAGAADVDRDGRPELILAGINNRLGYAPAVAAVRLVPAVNQPMGPGRALVGASPDALYSVNPSALAWYALLPRRTTGDVSRFLRIDEPARTIRVEGRIGGPVDVSFDGFLGGTPSLLPPGARRAARADGYARLREAKRLSAAGFGGDAVREIEAAVACAERAGDPIFAEHARRVQGQLLVAAGRHDEAEALFTRVAAGSDEVPDLAFDAARAFHLAGELERAVRWYRRGLGPGGMSSLGRGKWEFLEGLVFALDELGRPEEAAGDVDRFASSWQAESGDANREAVAIFRDFLRWRSGEPPRRAWGRPQGEQPDVMRYLTLEMVLAEGAPPEDLLPAVDAELERTSDALPMLLSLRAVLLARLGRSAEAAGSGRRAVEELAHRIDDEVYGRTFRGLVEARAAWVRLDRLEREGATAAAAP